MEPTLEKRKRAEQIYAQHLADRSSGADLATLREEHPEIATEIEETHRSWQRASGVYEALVRGRSTGLSGLASGAPRESRAANVADSLPRRVLRRLEAHAPRESRYEILEEIDRGGMGSILRVWDPDLRRNMAMKVLLVPLGDGTDTESSRAQETQLARFLEEAQVTSQLDHPGIVPVHEMGVGADARVYFTMRLVKGRTLQSAIERVRKGGSTEWTLTRAVQVVQKICEAMAYAHEKKVLHRDLKPANVMIGRFGEVYVMDWGLARVLGREDTKDIRLRKPGTDSKTIVRTDRKDAKESGTASPLMTMDGDVVGTPAYMSPEQARGDLEHVDQRSDVYSVGTILYHLLVGHMPYVPHGKKMNNYAVWGLVRAGPPEPLERAAPEAPAELVAICEKAMARAPRERYPTMQALGADLQSFLEGRVVRAYEGGALAEFRKWVLRNRGTATASAAAILLFFAGLATVAFVQVRARENLEEKNVALAAATLQAERERDAADRVSEFLVGLFESPDPRNARGETVMAKTILDRGARTIRSELAGGDPLLEARIMDAMGRAYHSLGLLEESEPLLERVVRERRLGLGPEHPDYLDSLADLALLYQTQGRYEEGEELYAEAIRGLEGTLGHDHEDTLRVRADHAAHLFYQGLYERSEELHRDVLAGMEAALGSDHPLRLRTLVSLALLHRTQARYEDAQDLLEEALAGLRRELGNDHPETLEALNDYASVRLLRAEYAEAEELYTEVLEGRRRVLGDDHPDTLITTNDLAYLYSLQGRSSESEELYERALQGHRTALGPEHPLTLKVMNNLAALYQSLARGQEAEELLRAALDASLRVRGGDHPDTLGTLNNLAWVCFAQGRYDEAEPFYRDVLDGYRRVVGEDHPNTLVILHRLAETVLLLGRPEEAEPLAAELLQRTPQDDEYYQARADLMRRILDEP